LPVVVIALIVELPVCVEKPHFLLLPPNIGTRAVIAIVEGVGLVPVYTTGLWPFFLLSLVTVVDGIVVVLKPVSVRILLVHSVRLLVVLTLPDILK
jgi:hypothetical protein